MTKTAAERDEPALGAPRFRPSKRAVLIFVASVALYHVVFTLASYKVFHEAGESKGSLFSLVNSFGPLIESIVERGEYSAFDYSHSDRHPFTAHRMPLIPYGLALIARIKNNILFASILKNAICAVLLGAGLYRLWRHLPRLPLAVLAAALAYVLTFPKLGFFHTILSQEEGYLTAMLFLLFTYLITWPDRRSGGRVHPAVVVLMAVLNAALYLTKSSMLPVAVVLCVAFFAVSRSRAVLGAFAACLAVSMIGWGLHNQLHSGRFRVDSSYDGWNLYKGNNPYALEFYPVRSLDELDAFQIIGTTHETNDEWDLNADFKAQAVEFIRDNPGQVLRLAALKAWVMFGEIRTTPMLPRKAGMVLRLEWINRAHMLVFRLLFVAAVVLALRAVADRSGSAEASRSRRIALSYLAVTGAYAAPYLIGFGWQRHVFPMVLPTLGYFLYAMHELRPAGAGRKLR